WQHHASHHSNAERLHPVFEVNVMTCGTPTHVNALVDLKEPIDQSVCSDATCNNGGTCEADADGGIKCLCKAGFFGQFCEERVNPCEKRPCDHGYCKPSDPAGFECECEE
ncbi:EGF-like domain protein, partial [Teladorsagia circumcincta]